MKTLRDFSELPSGAQRATAASVARPVRRRVAMGIAAAASLVVPACLAQPSNEGFIGTGCGLGQVKQLDGRCAPAPEGGSGSGGSGSACVPGQSAGCVGPGACAGYQVCDATGSGYGPCDCPTNINCQIDCTTAYQAGYDDYANIVLCMQQACPQCVS